MTLKLDRVVPWGRSFEEYVRMFRLTPEDLHRSVLGCADGPASFNAELTQSGGRIISCDPIYECSADEILTRIEETAPNILRQVKSSRDDFLWTHFSSPEELLETRLRAMNLFCDDFRKGGGDGRYIAAALPDLPFEDGAFDLALCSHFLFLYSDVISLEFHISSIHELLRVSKEVRIFPVLELSNKRSRHLVQVIRHFVNESFLADLQSVDYEFQKGADQMLRIVR